MTRGLIASDARRAFGARFVFALCCVPILILADSSVDLIASFQPGNSLSVYYFYMNSIQTGGLYGRYLAGMLSAIPFAASFSEELTCGFAPVALARGGRRAYFRSKFAVNAFAAGCVPLLGMALLIAVLRAAGYPLFDGIDLQNTDGMFYMGSAAARPWRFFRFALYYAFLNGALLGGLSLWASGYVQNRYVVYTVPAVAIFAQIQIARMFDLPAQWRLDMLLVMRATVGGEGLTALIATGCAALALLLAALDFERRGRRLMGCG